jgi:hypothetical protein
VNRAPADAGLAVLNAGGDFADGVIAWEGRWLGGETFVSFDKKAVAMLARPGQLTRCSPEIVGNCRLIANRYSLFFTTASSKVRRSVKPSPSYTRIAP